MRDWRGWLRRGYALGMTRWMVVAAGLWMSGCGSDPVRGVADAAVGDVDAAQDCSRCVMECTWNAAENYHSTCGGPGCPAECHPYCVASFVVCGAMRVTTCETASTVPVCSTHPAL